MTGPSPSPEAAEALAALAASVYFFSRLLSCGVYTPYMPRAFGLAVLECIKHGAIRPSEAGPDFGQADGIDKPFWIGRLILAGHVATEARAGQGEVYVLTDSGRNIIEKWASA